MKKFKVVVTVLEPNPLGKDDLITASEVLYEGDDFVRANTIFSHCVSEKE